MKLTKKWKEFITFLVLLTILWIIIWIYNHITQIVIVWLFVLWVWLWYFLYKLFYDKFEKNKWWYLVFIIPLIPIIFSLNILVNFDTYDKYFKKSIIEWFIKWTKAVLCASRPRFCWKMIKKEIKRNVKKEVKYWSWWVLDSN